MADTVWDTKTLTGMTLKDVYEKIDSNLGKNAYSQIFGTNLTDIKPAFVYELLTECFGPHGIGWGYEVIESQVVRSETRTSSRGREYTTTYAEARVKNWYALEGGVVIHTGESVGGSWNEEIHYAHQGAITNAIGNGWSRFGVQRHVYKNETAAPRPSDPKDGAVKPDPEEAARRAQKAQKDTAKLDNFLETLKAEGINAEEVSDEAAE